MDDAALLTSELVTNSLRHGLLAVGAPVVLKVDIFGYGVRVEVVDSGAGFGSEDLERRLPGPHPDDSGWGLFFVEELADAWGVDALSGGTCVWFEMSVVGQSSESEA